MGEDIWIRTCMHLCVHKHIHAFKDTCTHICIYHIHQRKHLTDKTCMQAANQEKSGGKAGKSGGKEVEGFLQYYMEQLTDAFGEDLDKMRREVCIGIYVYVYVYMPV